MADEARHVAFGVLSLQEYYAGLTHRRAAGAPGVRLRGRRPHARPLPPTGGVGPDGGRPEGHPPAPCCRPRTATQFQALLFSKIVPNCRKLGLLDAADGWLRTKFTELGVIEFESAVDTSEEYDAMAAVPPTQRELV